MATIDRPPLYTRIPPRDYGAALQAAQPIGSSLVLLLAAVLSAPFKPPIWPNPILPGFNPELRTLINDSIVDLIQAQPVAGFGWMDTPPARTVQEPFITPNVALRAAPVFVPFSQLDWPNPTQPDKLASQRAFTFRNAQTSVVVAGSPLTGYNPVSWDNPIRPSTAVYAMPWVAGINALPLTPPPVGTGNVFTDLSLSIRIAL